MRDEYECISAQFCRLAINHFLFISEVFSFLFWSSFDSFCATADDFCSTMREMVDPRFYRHDTASISSMDADTASPASLLLAGVACLLPPCSRCRPPMKLCHWGPAVSQQQWQYQGHDEAVSLVVCSINWSVVTVNIIRLHGLHVCPQLIISSSYT